MGNLKTAAAALALCSLPAPCVAAAELRLADAVRMALEKNASVQVQESQVDAARGRQLQAEGQFDTVLSSGVNYSRQVNVPYGPGPQSATYGTGYQVGVARLLRNGTTVSADLDASSSLDGSLPAAQPQGGQVRLGVTLTVPLLKGRGALEVTAEEDAARLQVEAGRYLLRSQAAQVLQQTLSAYWTYSARVALYQVAVSSEARSRNLLGSTQKLVDAAEKPRADLVLLNADLADKMAARQAAELAVLDARNALGRVLGLDAQAISALPEPADLLPPAADLAPASGQLDILRSDALAQRADLRALALQIEAAEREVQAARHRLKPALDLEIGVNYAKTTPSRQHYAFINDAGRMQSGPSVGARLNYQFPVQNKVAGGVLQERSALLTQLSVQQRDLAAGVANGVEGALQALASSAGQLKVAQQALGLYEQAVNQEIVKQKNGIATLIDVINVEARFVNARINMLQTQLAYAQALARLRYETGTLLPASAPAGADAGSDRFILDPAGLAGLGPLAGRLAAPH